MGKRKFYKQYPEGGGMTLPTRQDSLNLLNNSKALLDFYKKEGYYNTGDKVADDVLKKQKLALEQFKAIHPEIPLSDYYREDASNPNIYQQRETAVNKINYNAPMGMYDKRIKPNKFTTYSDGSINADNANVPSYDPLSVTPWDMLSKEDRVTRLNKYGTSGTPFKNNAEMQTYLNTGAYSPENITPNNTQINPKDTNKYTAAPFLKQTGSSVGYKNYGDNTGRKAVFAPGGNLNDYYKAQLNQEQALMQGIAGIGLGALGTAIGGPIGGQLGTMIGSNLFPDGGNMITEIPNNAGTHEESSYNGVPIPGYDSLVEEGETINNETKMVASNRLKPNASIKQLVKKANPNLSYAENVKKRKKDLLGLRPGDQLGKDLLAIEEKTLTDDQEAQKQYMDIMNQANDLYTGIMAMGGNMYPIGGPLTEDEKLNKLYEEYKNNAPGQFETKDSLIASNRFNEQYLNNLLGYESGINPNKIIGTPNKPYTSVLPTNILPPKQDLTFNRKPIDKIEPMKSLGINGTTISNNRTPITPNNSDSLNQAIEDSNIPGTKKKSKFGKALPYTQLLGPASQMLTSLFNRNRDLANLNYRTPEYTPIDEFYAAKLAEQQQDRANALMTNAARSNATDQGTYLATMLAANAGMAGQTPGANLAYDAMIKNVAGRNTNAMQKTEIQNRNIDEREKLLDNSREEFTNSLYNAGAVGAGLYRDKAQQDQWNMNNEIFAKNVGKYYDIDLNTGELTPKKQYQSKFGGKLKKK